MTQENLGSNEPLNNVMQDRRDKLNALREKGQAYPNDFRRDALSRDVFAACKDKSTETLEEEKNTYTIAGRVMTRRIMGKAGFGIVGLLSIVFSTVTTTFLDAYSAGVSAVPMAARVSQTVGQEENPSNFLLMHAMGPNVAGVIGSAVAAGVLLGFLS